MAPVRHNRLRKIVFGAESGEKRPALKVTGEGGFKLEVEFPEPDEQSVTLTGRDLRRLSRAAFFARLMKTDMPLSREQMRLLKKYGLLKKVGTTIKCGFGPFPPRPKPDPLPSDTKVNPKARRRAG